MSFLCATIIFTHRWMFWMQIQADFCYLTLQIHNLHEQELERDEHFE